MKILHVMILDDKFIPPFIKFINENFDPNDHIFAITDRPRSNYDMDLNFNNVFWLLDGELKIVEFERYLHKAKKIILHGLWDVRILELLSVQPWLLKKAYWVMWGGDFYLPDLYLPEMYSDLKKQLIKKIRNVITYTDGDVDYLKKTYQVNPLHHKCLMYLSNIFDENKYKRFTPKLRDEILILVGNSADKTNRHEFIFDKIRKFSSDNIKVVTPLSYSYRDGYRERIINIGKEIFGEKFHPLTEFLPYDKYLEILFNVDIAIFAHNRQQGVGNLIQLLGLGKKVYLNPETSQWNLCQNLGIKVYDVNGDIDLTMNSEELENNKSIVKEVFSFKNLKAQLKEIFDE